MEVQLVSSDLWDSLFNILHDEKIYSTSISLWTSMNIFSTDKILHGHVNCIQFLSVKGKSIHDYVISCPEIFTRLLHVTNVKLSRERVQLINRHDRSILYDILVHHIVFLIKSHERASTCLSSFIISTFFFPSRYTSVRFIFQSLKELPEMCCRSTTSEGTQRLHLYQIVWSIAVTFVTRRSLKMSVQVFRWLLSYRKIPSARKSYYDSPRNALVIRIHENIELADLRDKLFF